MLSPGDPRTDLKDKWERTKNGKAREGWTENRRERARKRPTRSRPFGPRQGRDSTGHAQTKPTRACSAGPAPRREQKSEGREESGGEADETRAVKVQRGGEGVRPRRHRSFEAQRHTDTAWSTTVTCLFAFSC